MRDWRLVGIAACASAIALLQQPQRTYAQDGTEGIAARTPENAQAFLSSLLPSVFFDSNKKQYFKIEKVYSNQRCRTTYKGTLAEFSEGSGWMPSQSDEFSEIEVDWQKVEDIQFNESERAYYGFYATILMPRNIQAKEIVLYFDVKQSRNRSLAAMTYLTEACDPTKNTGF